MSEFKKVARLCDIPAGEGKTVSAEDRKIALFNVGGELCATDDACAHMGGPLGEGTLSGGVVTCPWHDWKFDVKSGVCARTKAQVKVYPVKLEGDEILVAI